MDLALNNLQRLICHKTKENQTKPYISGACMQNKKTNRIKCNKQIDNRMTK